MMATYNFNTSWEKVRRVFPTGVDFSILDLGCGDGRVIQHLVSGHDVYGLDHDHEAVKQAYSLGINAVTGDIGNVFPFPDTHFDIVTALDVLEHVNDFDTVFAEVRRVLKPDGYFILSMPNHFDLRTRFDILFGKGIIRWSQRQYGDDAWNYAHLRFLTLADARRMFTRYGWHIDREQFNFLSGGLLPARLMPRAVRRLLVSWWPSLWSGKLVFRARPNAMGEFERIIIDRTPDAF